jgi:hypothetical protein
MPNPYISVKSSTDGYRCVGRVNDSVEFLGHFVGYYESIEGTRGVHRAASGNPDRERCDDHMRTARSEVFIHDDISWWD